MEIRSIIFGGVVANCYLIKTKKGFILIDTGRKSKLKALENELMNAGCRPGNLDLIILTHGDFDHSGNCAYLKENYKTQIAMHQDDFGMVEKGDMFWNRNSGNRFAKKIVNALFSITKFKPDFSIDDGYDLHKYGLDAKVLHIPGHSKGSIGILLTEGDFFCGDLFVNSKTPELNTIIDNKEDADNSLEKIKNLNIKTIYPGHGNPFPIESLRL